MRRFEISVYTFVLGGIFMRVLREIGDGRMKVEGLFSKVYNLEN